MNDVDRDPIVRLEAVEKIYRQGQLEVAALRGLDLEVTAGEFTALTGPSGSGKTTALNLMGALDKPTLGRVILEGSPDEVQASGEVREVYFGHV